MGNHKITHLRHRHTQLWDDKKHGWGAWASRIASLETAWVMDEQHQTQPWLMSLSLWNLFLAWRSLCHGCRVLIFSNPQQAQDIDVEIRHGPASNHIQDTLKCLGGLFTMVRRLLSRKRYITTEATEGIGTVDHKTAQKRFEKLYS